MNFELKKWNAVAMWNWKACADNCAICRNGLQEASIGQGSTGSEDCKSIGWGECGHVYHLDCISKWTKTRDNCPLCNKNWAFIKIEKIA